MVAFGPSEKFGQTPNRGDAQSARLFGDRDMAEIGSLNNFNPASSAQVAGVERYQRAAAQDNPAPATPVRQGDRVEISSIARSLAEAAPEGVRADLVARVRAEIASGTYDTEERFEAAVSSLIDDLRLDV